MSFRFPDRALSGALAVLALVVLSGGCTDRPRSNPLDPNNPDTGGGPATFTAIAQNGQVELRWTRAALTPSWGGSTSTRIFPTGGGVADEDAGDCLEESPSSGLCT